MNESQATQALRSVQVAKLRARLKSSLHTTISKIISENNSAAQKFRWAVRDRNQLKELLQQIAGLINKLEFLLDSAERQQEKGEYHRLLKEVISLITTTTEAGQIKCLSEGGPAPRKSINAAVYLNQVRLVLGAGKTRSHQGESPILLG
ncbi:hypothetical protein F4823DRAFT_559783 [Ustulina deusta]|nr:hypothetical protein F4823DRAFT_559783 [Ustulina deusta]